MQPDSPREDSPRDYNGMAWLAAAAVLLVVAIGAFLWHSGLHLPPANPGPLTDNPSAKTPTVASLTPAGTDLMIGIGAASHLVAVSDLDEERAGIVGLPHAGDFRSIDWEKLAALKPDVLLTQYGDRVPAVVKENCDRYHMRILDVKLNLLADIDTQAKMVAEALNEEKNEQAALDTLHSRLKVIQDRNASLPLVRTAIVVNDGGDIGLIGPGSFHDEILTLVGGQNVAASFDKPYVSIDREQLTALAPDCILELQPTPPTSPQQARQAAEYWQTFGDLPAIRNKHLYVIDAPYCERPGYRVADLAEIFEKKLRASRAALPRN